jgi:hypothetical protein
VKSFLKRTLLPGGWKMRRLRGGIARHQLMTLDLQTQLQRFLGLDEKELAGIVSKFCSSCRTLIDVGANDGYYTLAFLASPADQVIACEPGPANTELLANAAANGHQLSTRFHLERRLVGCTAGEASLAEIFDGCPTPIFVKVDVDGGEVEVLQSAQSHPALRQTSFVVETHSAELEQNCLEWFSIHGFSTEIINAAWWRLLIPEKRPPAHNRWIAANPLA